MLAADVPAGGYKTYPMDTAASADPEVIPGRSIENKYFKITFNPERGVISSFVDKSTGKEWIDAEAEQGLGQYMNERFTLEQTLELVTPSMEARMPMLVSKTDGPGGDLPAEQEGIRTSRDGIAVTAFGSDFDGSGGTLLRVWEQGGIAGEVIITLSAGCKAQRAKPVNLRGEGEGKALLIRDSQFRFDLGAFAPASFILTNS